MVVVVVAVVILTVVVEVAVVVVVVVVIAVVVVVIAVVVVVKVVVVVVVIVEVEAVVVVVLDVVVAAHQRRSISERRRGYGMPCPTDPSRFVRSTKRKLFINCNECPRGTVYLSTPRRHSGHVEGPPPGPSTRQSLYNIRQALKFDGRSVDTGLLDRGQWVWSIPGAHVLINSYIIVA